MTKRRIILEVDIPEDHPERLLMVCTDLCDFMEKYKDADLIPDYGLGLEVPQYAIKKLPRCEEEAEKE